MPDRRHAAVQPSWIYKRDGRLVPFEADKISHSLFAASERLGLPNAFLARELADGVLHFLSGEVDGAIPTTLQVGEIVTKVVRELGQPALAQAYTDFRLSAINTAKSLTASDSPDKPSVRSAPYRNADRLPVDLARLVSSTDYLPEIIWRAGSLVLGEYAAREVYARDLLAAQSDGWIALGGPATAFEFEGAILAPPSSGDFVIEHEIGALRKLVGGVLALDAANCFLTGSEATGGLDLDTFLRRLTLGLEAAGFDAVLNLNLPRASTDAGDWALGPLYSEEGSSASAPSIPFRAESFLERWPNSSRRGRFRWHVGAADFAPENAHRLIDVVRRALEGANLTFVFDRRGTQLSWADGLNAGHPAVLLSVGLYLPRLAKEIGEGHHTDGFLKRLGSLARLAISAGRQKRDFLRNRSPNRKLVNRGFMLDRASLVVIPIGIEAVCRELFGSSTCHSNGALEFAVQIMRRLREVLNFEGQTSRLNVCLDSTADFLVSAAGSEPRARPSELDPFLVAGITCWDPQAKMRAQVDAAGAMQSVTRAGTAAIFLDDNEVGAVEGALDLLNYAYHHSEIERLRFLNRSVPQQQLVASWAQ